MKLGAPLVLTNLTQLQNLLYNKVLQRPYQFWYCLGQVLKLFTLLDAGCKSQRADFCQILRALVLHIFKLWKAKCPASYDSFSADLCSPDRAKIEEIFSKPSRSPNEPAASGKGQSETQAPPFSQPEQSIPPNGSQDLARIALAQAQMQSAPVNQD